MYLFIIWNYYMMNYDTPIYIVNGIEYVNKSDYDKLLAENFELKSRILLLFDEMIGNDNKME